MKSSQLFCVVFLLAWRLERSHIRPTGKTGAHFVFIKLKRRQKFLDKKIVLEKMIGSRLLVLLLVHRGRIKKVLKDPYSFMFRFYPYSTKTREVVVTPYPTVKRFPETQKRFGRAEEMDFQIPPEFWWSQKGHKSFYQEGLTCSSCVETVLGLQKKSLDNLA